MCKYANEEKIYYQVFFALMHVIKYFAKGYTNNSVYEASQ